MDKGKRIKKLVLSGLFLATTFVLPFLTGQVPEIGSKLCPMHIPVLLCGFICGPAWGSAVGFCAPLLRSLTLGVPLLFPSALCMAFELGVYGLTAGLFHRLLPRKKPYIYLSLLLSMVLGRLVWGAAMFVCLGITGGAFTFGAFMAGAFTGAIPGIIIQIILIPLTVMLIDGRINGKSSR